MHELSRKRTQGIETNVTFVEPNIPKSPTLFLNLEADKVPFMVSDRLGGWDTGVWSPFNRGQLKSSKGMSPGGVNPDLYFSMTRAESCKKKFTITQNIMR